MSVSQEILDRARGVVVVGAVGDALGAGYECSVAPLSDEVTMLPGTLTGEPAGYWTDDTAMAIAVLEVAAREGTLDDPKSVAAVGDRFLDWYRSSPLDIGNHTRIVMSKAKTGGDLSEAAHDASILYPQSASNGSLMRTGPVALAHLGDDAAIGRAASAVSRLTHAHNLCVSACVLWSVAIDRAVRLGSLEGPRAGLYLLDVGKSWYWEQRITEAENNSPLSFNPNGGVVAALQAAWSAIYITQFEDNPLEAGLRQAVAVGDDTDTVAAIAGYLLGGYYGFGALRVAWVEGLAGWPGEYRAEDLCSLVDQAVTRSSFGAL